MIILSIREANSHRVLSKGLTSGERVINTFKTSILSHFNSNDPSYFEVTRNDEIELIGALITDNSSSAKSEKVDEIKTIVLHPSKVLCVGDLFNYLSQKWLCIQSEQFNNLYYKGFIKRVNNILKFYSKKDMVFYNIPCNVDNKVVLGSDETDNIMAIGNELFVTVPNNPITQQIKPNDIFKIGLNNYTISTVGDDISQSGIIIFKMKYSEEEQVLPTFSLEILNSKDSLKTIIGAPLKIDCQLLVDEKTISSPLLAYSSSDEKIITVSKDGQIIPLSYGSALITVKLSSDETIQDSVLVEVVDTIEDKYTYTLIGDNEIKLGQTKAFSVQKFKNGIEEIGSFEFEINDDGVSDAYFLTILSDNSCSIKCNNYVYYITLKAIDKNNSLSIEKTIKLRSIF